MSVTINPAFGIIDNTTDGIVLPIGTTAERPENPPIGTLRINSSDNTVEYYNGEEWITIGLP